MRTLKLIVKLVGNINYISNLTAFKLSAYPIKLAAFYHCNTVSERFKIAMLESVQISLYI